MKRKDLYYTIQDKYSNEKGIVKGSPASVLFRLGHGVTQEQWESELTPEDIAFFLRGTDISVDIL